MEDGVCRPVVTGEAVLWLHNVCLKQKWRSSVMNKGSADGQ